MKYITQKHAGITGISKGIGKCLTKTLLEAGAHVTGWGKTPPDYAHENLRFIPCDVTNSESVAQAWEITAQTHPQIDFLVNNAGFGYFSMLQDFDEAKFRALWEVNMLGAFLVSKAVVSSMLHAKSGHILNISSIAGRVGAAWGAGYNSSKWALTGFSESMFQELRSKGIKVTTVYPGSTHTHFFDEIPGVGSTEFMLDPQELAEMMVNVMNTSPNFLVREIEMRPLNSKPIK